MNIVPTTEDWITLPLSEIVVEKNGVQTGPFGSQLHKKDYVQIGTPIITVEHLGENRILHNKLPRVSDEDKERLAKYTLQEGDIVFSRVGSVDRRSFVRSPEAGWLFSGRCLRIRAKPEKIDPLYLSYYLGDPRVKQYVRSIAVGATMPSINTKILSDLPISLPLSQNKQIAIAHILETLGNKIALNQKMNQTLEEIAKAIFKSWFVDFDPVRAKAEGRPTGLPPEISDLFPDELMESEIGEMPKGWELKTLHDLLSTVSETYPLNAEDKVIFLNTGDIEAGVFLRNCYSPTDGLPGQAKKSIKQGDILFSEIRPKNKRYAFVDFDAKDYVVSTKLMVLRTKDSWNPYLPYFLITQDQTINYLQLLAEDRSGTFPQITYSQLGQVRFCLSTRRDLLEYFSNEILGSFYKKMSISRKENDTLSQLRDTLLPKLISGEFRIPDAEKFLEEAGV